MLVFVTRCFKGHEIECVKLRAAVISKILETKSVFIPNIPVNEGLLHPTQLYEYPLASIRHGDVPLYDMSMVLNPLLDVNSSTFDRSHRHCITLDRLLYWDPYINVGRGLLKELFNPAQENVELTDDFIANYSEKVVDWEVLASKVFKMDKSVIEAIQHQTNSTRPTLQCQQLLDSYMSFELLTFGRLRVLLDQFSVFGGRDMIVSREREIEREREMEMQREVKEEREKIGPSVMNGMEGGRERGEE